MQFLQLDQPLLAQKLLRLTGPSLRTCATRRSAPWIAVGLAALAALGDLETGSEVPFTLCYLAPIGLATWFVAFEFGIAVSALCTLAATSAQVLLAERASQSLHVGALIWTHAATFVLFCIFVYVLGRLRSYVEKEQRDRRLAVDQLRHAERLNLVGKLAAGIAHELGTPLNIISASLELMDEGRANSDFARRQLSVVSAQTQRMAAIIRQLLDFSRRGGSGRSVLDLREVVRGVLELLEPGTRKGKASITTDFQTSPVWVSGNPVELGQVVSNLVLNAVQAMPAGGRIRVSCRVANRAQRGSLDNAIAELSVEDEGTGISPEHLSVIFDPFFTTKPIGVGTGLGLSVSYGIVHDHGGRIHVQSRLKQGSCFTVSLPAVEAPAAQSPGDAQD